VLWPIVCRVSLQSLPCSLSLPCVLLPFPRGQLSAVCRRCLPPWPDGLPCATLARITADIASAVSLSILAHGRASGHGNGLFSCSARPAGIGIRISLANLRVSPRRKLNTPDHIYPAPLAHATPTSSDVNATVQGHRPNTQPWIGDEILQSRPARVIFVVFIDPPQRTPRPEHRP
jgi:hypothetical protein